MRNKRDKEQGFIIFLIPIIIIVVLVIIFSSSGNNEEDQTAESTDKTTISQTEAESYCQDAGLLEKYINLNETSIVSVSDYNVHYQDDGVTYDKDGYLIKNLQWTGVDKSTDKNIRFSCWVSGPGDNTTLHWLSVDGQDLEGSGDFDSYSKDGEKLE